MSSPEGSGYVSPSLVGDEAMLRDLIRTLLSEESETHRSLINRIAQQSKQIKELEVDRERITKERDFRDYQINKAEQRYLKAEEGWKDEIKKLKDEIHRQRQLHHGKIAQIQQLKDNYNHRITDLELEMNDIIMEGEELVRDNERMQLNSELQATLMALHTDLLNDEFTIKFEGFTYKDGLRVLATIGVGVAILKFILSTGFLLPLGLKYLQMTNFLTDYWGIFFGFLTNVLILGSFRFYYKLFYYFNYQKVIDEIKKDNETEVNYRAQMKADELAAMLEIERINRDLRDKYGKAARFLATLWDGWEDRSYNRRQVIEKLQKWWLANTELTNGLTPQPWFDTAGGKFIKKPPVTEEQFCDWLEGRDYTLKKVNPTKRVIGRFERIKNWSSSKFSSFLDFYRNVVGVVGIVGNFFFIPIVFFVTLSNLIFKVARIFVSIWKLIFYTLLIFLMVFFMYDSVIGFFTTLVHIDVYNLFLCPDVTVRDSTVWYYFKFYPLRLFKVYKTELYEKLLPYVYDFLDFIEY